MAFVPCLGIEWGEAGGGASAYARGRAFGSSLDGADTFAEWRRRGGRRCGHKVLVRRAEAR